MTLLPILFFTNCFSQQFNLSYSPIVLNENFTGNVIVYLSKENKTPKNNSVGIDIFPCFSLFVKNVRPGQSVFINDFAISYPTSISNIERGSYYAQVVWDRNLGERSIASSPGNLYSLSTKINITKNYKEIFKITATQVIPKPAIFRSTQYVKEIKAPTSLLSNFLKKDITMDGAVILPKEYYTEPTRKFPVLFIIMGYGGDYRGIGGDNNPSIPVADYPFIKVYLDGNCSFGHSVYANSENNGPWGDALVQNFIPFLEKEYRCNGARLLTGHSSGGWSSLWLQITYPKVFSGCWSSSPDAVDFGNFQNVNLYDDMNMFYNKENELNLVSSIAGEIPWMTMKTVYQIENVIYRGEQMHSFNAVFSKKGRNGLPENLVNNLTGVINKKVLENWKNYDISLILKNNWVDLKKLLDGMVRISVGKQDNFFLNKSVMLLDQKMKLLGSPFKFAYYNGDHFTVSAPEYKKDGYAFLGEKYLEWVSKNSEK